MDINLGDDFYREYLDYLENHYANESGGNIMIDDIIINSIKGKGSYGHVLSVNINGRGYALKIVPAYDCKNMRFNLELDPAEGVDYTLKEEYKIMKIMEKNGVGPEVYDYMCIPIRNMWIPSIRMELFDTSVYAHMMDPATTIENVVHCANMCNVLIDRIVASDFFLFDVKPQNFVYKKVRNGDFIRMIDFDQGYLVRKDNIGISRILLPPLLKMQMCFIILYGMNEKYKGDARYQAIVFKLYQKYAKQIITNENIFKSYMNEHTNLTNTIHHYTKIYIPDKNITFDTFFKKYIALLNKSVTLYSGGLGNIPDEPSPLYLGKLKGNLFGKLNNFILEDIEIPDKPMPILYYTVEELIAARRSRSKKMSRKKNFKKLRNTRTFAQ